MRLCSCARIRAKASAETEAAEEKAAKTAADIEAKATEESATAASLAAEDEIDEDGCIE